MMYLQMVSERQRIEAAPTAPVETPPPPSYEEVNNVFTSPMQNGSSDEVDYFLGEVRLTKHNFKFSLSNVKNRF